MASTLTSFKVIIKNVLKSQNYLPTSTDNVSDEVSQYTLKNCAEQLASPLAALFTNYLKQKRWPKLWKKASVVSIQKKRFQERSQKL